MEKIIMLSGNLYRDVNAIRVSATYNKREGGYFVVAEPIEYNRGGLALFGKCFCREYYEHGGDGIAKRFPVGRRSQKKEAEAEAYCMENAMDIARMYIQDIKRKLGISNDVDITEEV